MNFSCNHNLTFDSSLSLRKPIFQLLYTKSIGWWFNFDQSYFDRQQLWRTHSVFLFHNFSKVSKHYQNLKNTRLFRIVTRIELKREVREIIGHCFSSFKCHLILVLLMEFISPPYPKYLHWSEEKDRFFSFPFKMVVQELIKSKENGITDLRKTILDIEEGDTYMDLRSPL